MAESEAGNAERLDELFPQPDPPRCPDGWVTGPPDFVGVGAPRSGTTWWHRVIGAHPDVSFERGLHIKEVGYFGRLGDRAVLSPEEIAAYHRYFPRADPDQLVGEWTPDYMYGGRLPQHLLQAAPEARALVLLRDPVERFASGFARGRRLAARNGIQAADDEIAARNVERGMYFEPIARLLDAFGRDRVLVLQYERCRTDYAAELRRTHEFLGLDPDRANMPPLREPRERPVPQDEQRRLAETYAAELQKLAELLPELDLTLWPSATHP